MTLHAPSGQSPGLTEAQTRDSRPLAPGFARVTAGRVRRWFIPGLFFVVLLTPFALRAFMQIKTSESAGSDAEKLVIITSHAEGIRREFEDAFRAYYKQKYNKDVKFDYIVYGSEDERRYLQDQDSLYSPEHPTLDVDLAWGGGDYLFDVQLIKYLAPVDIDPVVMKAAFPSPTINGLPLYDLKHKPPYWIGSALSGFGITYNRAVLRYLKLPDPQTWTDLTDPKYANWLILADPSKSTSSKAAFMAVVERAMADSAAKGESEEIGWARGMGTVRLICSNARMFTDSSPIVPGLIASGDGAAGMTIDYYGKTEVEAVGDRLGYVQPKAATIINPDPIALVKGAPHKVVATRFIEFVLSRQGQTLWDVPPGSPDGPRTTSLRRLPIMPSIYKDVNNLQDPESPFTSSAGFNKSSKREDPTFRIMGELIQCSCVNNLDELRAARQAIEASPNRAALEAKFAMFSVSEAEAIQRQKDYYGKNVDPLVNLERMRTWTKNFRDEYRAIKAEAEAK
jgi:iron(III) transport system substrate-binding protein